MKKIKNALLLILIVSIIIIGLSGCIDIVVPTNGTAKLIVSGSFYYNIEMDGYTYFSNSPSGTYYITEITPGYHTFKAVDTLGAAYGADSKTVYISANSTTTIYLDPTAPTGTVDIYVYGSWKYNIKMDGYTYFYDRPQGKYTLTNVSTGNHTFEAVDTEGASFGYDSKTSYIYTGHNNVYLYPEFIY